MNTKSKTVAAKFIIGSYRGAVAELVVVVVVVVSISVEDLTRREVDT